METLAPFKEVIDEIVEAGGEISKLCFQCGRCDAVCPLKMNIHEFMVHFLKWHYPSAWLKPLDQTP